LINILYGMIGIMLLALGRRLFWLFVGCVGFVAGLQVAQQYFGLQPVWMAWAVATLFGVIGALLAVFFQTLAIGLGGFAAGSAIAAYFATLMGFTAVPLISVIGGLIGAILLFSLFDWALIGLSSVAGSTLVVQALDWNPRIEMILFTGLIVAGIWFQASLLRRQHPTTK
jgi:hypothetical protein